MTGPEGPILRGPPARVRVGEPFELELRANPTTGFAWRLEIPPELALLEETHRRTAPRLGAGGVTVFRLVGARAGMARLTASYGRPWESTTVHRFTWSFPVDPEGGGDLGSAALGKVP